MICACRPRRRLLLFTRLFVEKKLTTSKAYVGESQDRQLEIQETAHRNHGFNYVSFAWPV